MTTTFPKASLNFAELLDQLKKDIKGLSIGSSETFQNYRQKILTSWRANWPEVMASYRVSLQNMPKGLRKREIIKSILNDLDRFDTEMKSFVSEIKNISFSDISQTLNRHFQELDSQINRFHDQLKYIANKTSELEEHTLIKKIMRGEAVFSCRTNLQWRRKIFHTLMGLSFLFLFVYAGLPPLVKNIIATFFITLSLSVEVLRHNNKTVKKIVWRFFGPLMREHEKTRVTAATHYIVSMAIVYYVFPLETATLTMLFIAVADPIAGIIGSTWGKIKIKTHVSLEGFLACFIACSSLAALCSTFIFSNTLQPLYALPFSIMAGLAGAIAESSFKKLDDNLVMPLLSAPMLLIIMLVFGII